MQDLRTVRSPRRPHPGGLTWLLPGFSALALYAAPIANADVDPHGGMLRYPDVSASHITFVYADDIWVVPREGGLATAAASPPGPELFPKFSPDGTTIAFIGNYDGDRDIYTIPTDGGVPFRVTHHPAAEFISDWTPDAKIIFNMNGLAGLQRQQQLFTVAPEGGLPQRLPVPYGAAGSVSPDGQWLAYTPFNRDFRTWKRYRGGLASDIWLFNVNTHESKRMTDWEGTDTIPMWHGRTVYYLSDQGESARLNIWSYDMESGQRRQVTTLADFDVKFPSIGPGAHGGGEIVFQYGADLHLLDLATGEAEPVEVTIPGDRPTIRRKSIDASKFIQDAAISATGKRAIIAARGDIWTAPAEHGALRNLTRTDAVHERSPVWSPDGRWIAYFSDKSGEYELYITQSDGKGETRQLTAGSSTFYQNPTWSPDSNHIAFIDKTGNIWLVTLETGEKKTIATDMYAFDFVPETLNWSHDSRWLTFALANEGLTSSIWLYNRETGERHKVTSGMFPDARPVFDRKGDFLYFAGSRSLAPTYSDIDTTWIYNDSGIVVAVPLREDVKSPFLPESDEETWKEEVETDEEKEEDAKDAGDDEEKEEGEAEEPAAEEAEEEQEEEPADEPVEDDGVSGTWTCTITGDQLPAGGLQVTVILDVAEDGAVSGSVSTPMGGGSISGTYDFNSGQLTATITTDEGMQITLNAQITNGSMTGTLSSPEFSGEVTGTRTAKRGEKEEDEKEDEKPREVVEIDLEGFESRAILLPIPPGNFGRIAVNDRNQLIYARLSQRGAGSTPAIKLFDINDDKPTEKDVAAGAGQFDISGDGKKILVVRGPAFSIQNASAGATGTNIDTSNLKTTISPPEEWKQIFNDAWRLMRIYFYAPNMHGVDWPAVRAQYEKMLADCVSRADVSFVIGEMISELNVGHAYYFGGDIESGPSENVGMLGADFALENGAYRITRIHEGAPWDADARGPLSQPGVDVKEGEYLLAVNGVEVDVSKDPWAAFVGLAGQVVTITVSAKPENDDEARDVLVEPLRNDADLRFRAWIEDNRQYVEEKTDGKVGYIYVPNTGLDGQTELLRQFMGQTRTDGLIIDERWNGGGQIPTRFIELLNRPVTNYWARPDQKDWPWPPDAHQGPKCMLINGPAGSGGDAFPYYFRQAGLGKLIGTRTWGGLVGISGTPGLIDNAVVTAPTFAFYELDGTWGVEGHGVDPDIEVIDDPAKMVDGSDPQLDAAIEHMLTEIREHPFVKPPRPDFPVRTGMGIPEKDK